MKACHDFNNVFTLFTAVPVLFIMYTNKDSNLISDAYYSIVRKHEDLTYTIQHVGTGIEKKVHANDIQLARGQTEWNIDPTWSRERKPKYTY